MAVKIQSGKVGIELSDPFAGQIKNLLDRIAPNVEGIISANINDVYEFGRNNWIVKSGFSADALDQEIKLMLSQGRIKIVGIIRNLAPYAYVIRSAKDKISKSAGGGDTIIPKGKRVWAAVIREPFDAKIADLNAQITKEILKIKD